MLRQDIPDHYKALGVARDANSEQIKKAYLQLSKQCHPDTLGPGANADVLALAEERFKAISFAYEVLMDTGKRARFDRDLEYCEAGPSHSFEEPDEHMRRYWSSNQAYQDMYYDTLWDDFISRPFDWSERSLAFYDRWELLVGTLLIIGIIAHFAFGWMPHLPNSGHAATDAIFIDGFIGTATAMLISFACLAHAVYKHRRTLRRNADFRWELLGQASNMAGVLCLLLTIAGAIIGFYRG